jgi:hypothetical protein
MPKFYDIPETYLADPALRLQYGQAFAAQAARNPRLQGVSFWTTPGGGPNMIEQNSAYPFTIEDFLPPTGPGHAPLRPLTVYSRAHSRGILRKEQIQGGYVAAANRLGCLVLHLAAIHQVRSYFSLQRVVSPVPHVL